MSRSPRGELVGPVPRGSDAIEVCVEACIDRVLGVICSVIPKSASYARNLAGLPRVLCCLRLCSRHRIRRTGLQRRRAVQSAASSYLMGRTTRRTPPFVYRVCRQHARHRRGFRPIHVHGSNPTARALLAGLTNNSELHSILCCDPGPDRTKHRPEAAVGRRDAG